MNQMLYWCLGKFMYAKGGQQPFHFMPLKTKLIEDSIDYTHLFYLRTMQDEELHRGLIDDEAMKKWMEASAVSKIANAAFSVLDRRKMLCEKEIKIVEIFPGVGVTIEYLDLLIKQKNQDEDIDYDINIKHIAVGPEAYELKYNVLHENRALKSKYYRAEDWKSKAKAVADDIENCGLLIINHNQEFLQRESTSLDYMDIVEKYDVPTILACRVTENTTEEIRTTIKGKDVTLRPLASLLNRLREMDNNWLYSYYSKFDSEFMLPSSEYNNGLFLGATAKTKISLEGFQELG